MVGTVHYPYSPDGPKRPDDLYLTRPPWDIGRPQPAFLALAEAGALKGRVLDAGCGTGEHTLMCGGLGLDATGVDLATTALETARSKARERGLAARFLLHDGRRLAELGELFDTVLDCGLFHVLGGYDRAAYVDGLRSVLRPGGRYFMLAFSDRQPGDWGPHRLARDEIVEAFAEGWRIDSLAESTIEVTTGQGTAIPAWLGSLSRI